LAKKKGEREGELCNLGVDGGRKTFSTVVGKRERKKRGESESLSRGKKERATNSPSLEPSPEDAREKGGGGLFYLRRGRM